MKTILHILHAHTLKQIKKNINNWCSVTNIFFIKGKLPTGSYSTRQLNQTNVFTYYFRKIDRKNVRIDVKKNIYKV